MKKVFNTDENLQKKICICKPTPPLFKDHDFIEVTEWANGEGYDITVGDKPIISLHEVEFEYIKKLIEHLNS